MQKISFLVATDDGDVSDTDIIAGFEEFNREVSLNLCVCSQQQPHEQLTRSIEHTVLLLHRVHNEALDARSEVMSHTKAMIGAQTHTLQSTILFRMKSRFYTITTANSLVHSRACGLV